MVECAKIWAPSLEPEPEGAFHPSRVTQSIPSDWYKEPPAYAAELYTIMLGGEGVYDIHVIGTDQKLYKFRADVWREWKCQIVEEP